MLLLFVVLIFITAMVNFSVFDERLNPELAAMTQTSDNANPEDNAYVAIWGLKALTGRDMVAAGKRLIERKQENLNNKGFDTLDTQDYQDILGVDNTEETWLNGFSCTARTTIGCLSSTQSSIESMDLESDRSQLLMARHQRILQMPVFTNRTANTFTYLTPFPPYMLVLKLSQIKLARLSVSGSSAEVIEQLSVDMRFWRMMLENGTELIAKMVGNAGLWNDLQFLSDYMRTHDLSEIEKQALESILRPLTQTELNIADSFIYEQQSVFQTLNLVLQGQKLPDLGPLVSNWLIQPNATQNSYYENMIKPMLYLSELPRAEFATKTYIVNGIRRALDHDGATEMSKVWPGTPYNIGGKIFLKHVSGYYSAYIARTHDLNSMIALVNLQSDLNAENPDSIANILAGINSGGLEINKELIEQGLKFDSKEGWLQFDCLYGTRSICKIKLF